MKNFATSVKKELADLKEAAGIRSAIHDDPMAYYVAHAGKESWVKKYNAVKGFGLFGDSSFIIMMDGEGNFRMKGISFDPGDVANMASKVTTQALIMAVSMYGIPVPKGASSDDEKPDDCAMASANAAMQTKQDEVRKLEKTYAGYRGALIDIAKAILEKETLLKDPNKYKSAKIAFDNSFKEIIKRLEAE